MKKTKYNRTTKTSIFALCMVVLVGCSSSKNVAAPSYFILSNSEPAVAAQVSGTPQVSIRSVNTPDYLDKTGLARLIGGGKISISLKQMWAEKLSRSLPALIANEMEVTLDKPVATHPLPPGIHVKTNIDINIERFIADDVQVYLKQITKSYEMIK